MTTGTAVLAILLGLAGESATPALILRVEKPGEQLDRLIALFQGTRAADPATALASWKRATRIDLGKGTEAAIAALNPRMVRELATLDGAAVRLDFGDDGELRWSVTIPHDDGTFAAFATATVLTDGASEPPIEVAQIDRLGPPGSARMARVGSAVVLGGAREDVALGLRLLAPTKDRKGQISEPVDRPVASGWSAHVDAQALSRARSSLTTRRFAQAMLGLGSAWSDVTATLIGPRLQVGLTWDGLAGDAPPVDPAWVEAIPIGASLAFCLSIDPSPATWDRLFSALDRVEKADPGRAEATPWRVRLNGLASLAGLNPEATLFPKIRGLSGFVVGDLSHPSAVAIGLHAIDDVSADGWRTAFLPKLAHAAQLKASTEPGHLGILAGKDLRLLVGSGKTVWVAWGSATPPAHDERNPLLASPVDRERLRASTRMPGWVRPASLGLASAGSAWSEGLGASPAILWTGGRSGATMRDAIAWDGLDRVVRRALEVLPQKPSSAEFGR